MEQLLAKPSILRLGYCRSAGESADSARRVLGRVAGEVRRRWTAVPGRYALTIEQEFDGPACPGGKP